MGSASVLAVLNGGALMSFVMGGCNTLQGSGLSFSKWSALLVTGQGGRVKRLTTFRCKFGLALRTGPHNPDEGYLEGRMRNRLDSGLERGFLHIPPSLDPCSPWWQLPVGLWTVSTREPWIWSIQPFERIEERREQQLDRLIIKPRPCPQGRRGRVCKKTPKRSGGRARVCSTLNR